MTPRGIVLGILVVSGISSADPETRWGGLFVDCGSDLASCLLATDCFQHSVGACREDGTNDSDACRVFLRYCKPCFPFSWCGKNTTVDEATANLPNDAECLPHRIRVRNQVGQIAVVSCGFAEHNFPFPRPVELEGTEDAGLYQCCKNGPALPPYIQDWAFGISVYPLLALYTTSAIACIAIIIVLLITLQIQAESTYSGFNLYLVYLVIPDLLIAVFALATLGSTIDQKFHPDFGIPLLVRPSNAWNRGTVMALPLASSCAIATLVLHSVVSYQLLVLLRDPTNAQPRSSRQPPSLRRVNQQAVATYLFAVLYICGDRLALNAAREAETNGDFVKYLKLSGAMMSLACFVWLLPIGFMACVSVFVRCRGYLPSKDGTNSEDGERRELALFFFRIFAVFLGVWIPCLLFAVFGLYFARSWAFVIALSASSIQAMMTACLIFTKPDVRKCLLNLVTSSPLFGNDLGQQDTQNEPDELDAVDQTPRLPQIHPLPPKNDVKEADDDFLRNFSPEALAEQERIMKQINEKKTRKIKTIGEAIAEQERIMKQIEEERKTMLNERGGSIGIFSII